ncbi:MAG: thioredoxin domain-containing protein [Pirellulaceae bacterium]
MFISDSIMLRRRRHPRASLMGALALGLFTARNKTEPSLPKPLGLRSVCIVLSCVLTVIAGCQQSATEPEAEARQPDSAAVDGSAAEQAADTRRSDPAAGDEPATEPRLPKLVDLGATECIPCKMMAPILDELEKEYDGRMEVVFIDVWQNPDAANPYDIEQIPTQIFYDASGQELTRHTGFISKEDILKTWEEHGVELN